MLYTELTKKAMRLCYRAHDGQVDKGGVPYVFHPFHVAEQMHSEYDICVALMHDVLEDTDYTIEDIRSEGFPEEILQALLCITRDKNTAYEDYIRVVMTNDIATRVKLADLEHNSDISRLPGNDAVYHEQLLTRYAKARAVLLSKAEIN